MKKTITIKKSTSGKLIVEKAGSPPEIFESVTEAILNECMPQEFYFKPLGECTVDIEITVRDFKEEKK